MEVHPPEHGIRNWRDFFVHIGTITIGLLIAIGLEQTVEYLHRKHQLHTAERNLHAELENNRALLAGDERSLNNTEQQLNQKLAALENNPASDAAPTEEPVHWSWDGPQAAAWDTARDEGAVGLMEYSQASQYAVIYEQQKIVGDQATLYIRDIYAIAPIAKKGGKLSPVPAAELSEQAANLARALADLKLLRDYCLSLDRIYNQEKAP